MPKETINCERCATPAAYVRTQLHDFEDRDHDAHVGAVPLVKGGDVHVYKCPKCGHLTRVKVAN